MRPNDLPFPDETVIDEQVEQEVYLYSARSPEAVHRLNAGAAIIWYLCDGNRTVSEIATSISDEFAVSPHDAEHDVESIVAKLRALGLVKLAGSSQPAFPVLGPKMTDKQPT